MTPDGDVKVQINGQWEACSEGESIASLIARLQIDPRRVAVERNLEIVPKAAYERTTLSEGDRIEIVQFVGGG